ncbi:cupin domain-containing protein [Sporolactobacillus laevolacticus]|uniref:cupin domain-containing protein n=1 Tax=Sporolactobacillus laevolacticus TaxID=33018 RepID=UPI0025B62724|nr:cupin domain-containing protein [Sporolactobacillus laevolacticus]MDN3955184.1 cupin domain-containing protein [Sporolactobacillus laevolacticus]
MQKINLLKLVSDVNEYNNFVVSDVNDHVLRIAVIDGEFHWHEHETDELFMVLEGELLIDLDKDKTITLLPGETFTVPAHTQHRTRSNTRTVNLCFEKKDNCINGVS